jgi:hypothetical protein
MSLLATTPPSCPAFVAAPEAAVVRDALSGSYTVDPKLGNWADPSFKREFVQRCFRIVDEYAPNFSRSVIG